MNMQNVVTKSIRLNQEDSKTLAEISKKKGISEASIMHQFVLEGLAKQKLEDAITFYTHGEADLSAAAQYANISVYQMMTELERRDITPPAATEKFIDGLKTLVELFGGNEVLRQTINEFESSRSM